MKDWTLGGAGKNSKSWSRDPFAFFRGTDHLFWADFGPSRLLRHFGGKKSTRTWISGDLHCDNLGTFTDAMGWLVYDLNDFDEGVVADFQYDLWRLAVSLVLVGRRLKKKRRTSGVSSKFSSRATSGN